MKVSKSLIILLSLLFLNPIIGDAQKINKKQFVKKYNSFLNKNSKIVFFNTYQVVEKGEGKYVFKIFNPDKLVMTHYKTYKDKKRRILNGEFKEWYDSGNLWKEGQYENKDKTGEWSFYKDVKGYRYRYGSYKKGKRFGDWFSTDSTGNITAKYHYINDKLEGEYLRYDTEGKIFHKRIFKDGEEIESQILDSVYYKKKAEIDVMPVLKECTELEEGEEKIKCRDTKYLHYVYGNITYPRRARIENIEGRAILRFLVTKEGKISEIKILRGVCKEIEAECIRIIKGSPEWSPGRHNGKLVSVYFNMPVRFKLN